MLAGPTVPTKLVKNTYVEDSISRLLARPDEEFVRTMATAVKKLEDRSTPLWLLIRGLNLLTHKTRNSVVTHLVRGFVALQPSEQAAFALSFAPRLRKARQGWQEASQLAEAMRKASGDDEEDDIMPFVGTIGRREADPVIVEFLDEFESSLRKLDDEEFVKLQKRVERDVNKYATPLFLAKVFAELPEDEVSELQDWMVDEGTLPEESARQFFSSLTTAARAGGYVANTTNTLLERSGENIADLAQDGKDFWHRMMAAYEDMAAEDEAAREHDDKIMPLLLGGVNEVKKKSIICRQNSVKLHRPSHDAFFTEHDGEVSEGNWRDESSTRLSREALAQHAAEEESKSSDGKARSKEAKKKDKHKAAESGTLAGITSDITAYMKDIKDKSYATEAGTLAGLTSDITAGATAASASLADGAAWLSGLASAAVASSGKSKHGGGYNSDRKSKHGDDESRSHTSKKSSKDKDDQRVASSEPLSRADEVAGGSPRSQRQMASAKGPKDADVAAPIAAPKLSKPRILF